MNLTEDEYERFIGKTETTNSGCLIWTGPLDKDGYGTFYLRRKGRRAHRVAWFNMNGPIEEGMVINHVCRNRACVNHQHLKIMTAAENNFKDSTSIPYINSQKTHCKNGHPFDRKYGKQRYCSVCQSEKTKRLRAKWKAEGDPLKV